MNRMLTQTLCSHDGITAFTSRHTWTLPKAKVGVAFPG